MARDVDPRRNKNAPGGPGASRINTANNSLRSGALQQSMIQPGGLS